MGKFLTAKSRMQQTDVDGYWKQVDNELYMFDNGVIQMSPRHFWSDGYTFPSILLPITGDRHELDVMPAHQHDVECRFHERIIVNLTLHELIEKGYLRQHNNMTVCENIPKEHLTIEHVNKIDADNRLYDMMLGCGINKFKACTIRLGVVFNLKWGQMGKKSLNEYDLYNEDIGLVNGN